MIEQGIELLIQSGMGSPPLAPAGFLDELPKDYLQTINGPAYTYKFFGGKRDTGLTHFVGLTMRRCQVDCYAQAAANVLLLAKAISLTLQGFHGTLPDADSTLVYSILPSDEPMDFPYDAEAKSYRRMLEYDIFYKNTF